MSEDLVVIRTFSGQLEADATLAALRAAGIQSLLLSSGAPAIAPLGGVARDIGLAVHRRDVERAEEVLAPPPDPA
jgi:hypothetical protein